MNAHQSVSQFPFFKGLPSMQLEEILKIAVIKKFSKNEVIFSEGDDGNGFYIILTGLVKIYKISHEGKEHILHFFKTGDIFGEVPVFSGKSFPANAMAIKKSEVYFFPKQAFTDLITHQPLIALEMLGLLSKRLREFTVQIENLSLKEIPGRMASYLLYLSLEQKAQDTIELEISKGHLASLLGTIPETLSRILGKMADQGLIHVNGRKIALLDRAGIEELAVSGRIEKE